MAAGRRSIVGQVVDMLRLPFHPVPESRGSLPLRKAITLEGVSFSYRGTRKAALTDIDLKIPKGAMIALTGKTGAGKSTLGDIIMALLQPTGGRVCVDGVALTSANAPLWHRSVAHVAQSIFLSDSTIARNIALSLPGIPPDLERIFSAAKKAQLHDFVVSLPDAYDTIIGERGIRLSGGQRQRLGIARAI